MNLLIEKKDLAQLAILLLLALAIGTYLIATTVVIAKDGVSYINYAKQLEIDPLKIMRDPSPHAPYSYTPGYPFLILVAHNLVDLFGDGSSVSSWIYSAQSATLLCRVLSLIPLYFIGKLLVGSKKSFWAILILIILPYPAEFGSDALRDWPHILFLAAGFLLLLWSVKCGKWLPFGWVGFVAGLGYLIRPMCAQLVFYGATWLTYSMFRRRSEADMSRAKIMGAMILLIIGFAVVAAPHVKIRGEILPQRLRLITESFAASSVLSEMAEQNAGDYAAAFVPRDMGIGFGKLLGNVSEHLMYYFVPALVIGTYCYFRRKGEGKFMFFITIFISLNTAALLLRYCCAGPALSKRYVLPLIAFTIFFVPVGLEVMGRWIEGLFRKGFFVLLVAGVCMCLPKLFRPIRVEKKGYRLAAHWLADNTAKEDIVVVPDERISFYAGRKRTRKVRRGVKYLVTTVESKKRIPPGMVERWSCYLNTKQKKVKVFIYKRI